MIIRILDKVDLDGSGLAASGLAKYIMASGIDVAGFKEVTLVARLHPTPTFTGAPLIIFSLLRVAPTDQDPTNTYREGTAATSATFTLGTDVAPALKTTTLTSGVGGLVDLRVDLQQGSTGSASFKVTVSADLVMKV